MTDTATNQSTRTPRPEKVAVVEEVRGRLEASSAALVTEYRGLGVAELATLRTSLVAAGGEFKIYKNTLVRLAVTQAGVPLDQDMLRGPTAIAFVQGDAAAVAKALRDFARGNPNLVIKGGILGDAVLSADDTRALAELPSREVLLARLAGGLAAPLVGFAGLLQALPRNLAYGLKALIDQGGPEQGADAVAPAEPTTAPTPTTDGDEPAAVDTTDAEAPASADPDDTPQEAS